MYLNKLSEIPDGTFDANTHLTKLSINDNKISVVREATFSKVVRSSLRKLDLSGNPFVCDCGLRWFQAWFVAHRSLFGHFRKDYSCNNLPNIDVTSFYVADQACLLSQEALILIIVAVSLLLVVFITSSAVYHFRWDIRLVLYQAFRGQGDIRRRHLEEGNFRYDVFVSYDNEDLPWVETHLLPELEGRLRLRVCDHHRDFIPGKHILENIVDCVEASKKVMMLFSPNFVESPWCQFELKMCLQHVMDTDDMLVIILLEDVAPRDLTGSMRAVMNTVTYIPWSDEEEGRASFWGRIRLALHEVIE
nr:hypothetical protein BaRGS_010014 [Batillaria attramentaria]